VLFVSLGSTSGLRAADEQLCIALRRAGASVEMVGVPAPAQVRTMMLTDLAWARSARAAVKRGLAAHAAHPPRSIIYSSTTAALLWPVPGAIRFDAPAAGNRPGRHGLWQRPLERARLRAAPLLLPWSEGGLREASPRAEQAARALVLPVAVEPSGPSAPAPARDVAAITYAANPSKKGLDRVLAAWRALRERWPPARGEELLVAGVEERELERAGLGGRRGEGVRALGLMERERYRALLRRARVFVCAPRREDYGIAQLEALADGCMLVTTPAPGPYAALAIARGLDARLVGDDLAGALRCALEDPLPGYAQRALAALAPYAAQTIERLVGEQLLPRLLGERAQLGR